MDNKFVITSITRVLSIHSDEHTPKSSTYEHTLKSNELIFHFSGHTTVFFDDLIGIRAVLKRKDQLRCPWLCVPKNRVLYFLRKPCSCFL